MRIQYSGACELEIVGVGVVQPGVEVEVPEEVGAALLLRPDFERVKPDKRDPVARKPEWPGNSEREKP